MKEIVLCAITFIFVISISACGVGELLGPEATPTPVLISDEEFSEYAREVCSTLRAEIVTLEPQDFTARGGAYKSAVDTLSGLHITEQSAPISYLLIARMDQMADSYTSFGQALTKALSDSNISTPVNIMITEDGKVFSTSLDYRNIFEKMQSLTPIDIDRNLVAELLIAQYSLNAPAIRLGLEECIDPQLQSND